MSTIQNVIIITILLVVSFSLGYFIKGVNSPASETQNLDNQNRNLQNQNSKLQNQVNDIQKDNANNIPQDEKINNAVFTQVCPRPEDENGLKYGRQIGQYQRREPGTVVLKYGIGITGYPVTDKVYSQLEQVDPGYTIAIYNYTEDSLSGAETPYSCLEIISGPGDLGN